MHLPWLHVAWIQAGKNEWSQWVLSFKARGDQVHHAILHPDEAPLLTTVRNVPCFGHYLGGNEPFWSFSPAISEPGLASRNTFPPEVLFISTRPGYSQKNEHTTTPKPHFRIPLAGMSFLGCYSAVCVFGTAGGATKRFFVITHPLWKFLCRKLRNRA